MKLASADPASKDRVLHVISQEMNHAAPSLLMEGNFETLELFLDISMAGDPKVGAPNYSVYYLMRDKFDVGLEKVKNKKEFDDKRKQEIFVYMYRAKGDLKAALAAAEKLAAAAAAASRRRAPRARSARATRGRRRWQGVPCGGRACPAHCIVDRAPIRRDEAAE